MVYNYIYTRTYVRTPGIHIEVVQNLRESKQKYDYSCIPNLGFIED